MNIALKTALIVCIMDKCCFFVPKVSEIVLKLLTLKIKCDTLL